ncbi:MAG: hypothetical protein KR126chlam3_01274 [Chlamydiae bacterium]|nr:hypothetical protein [Chlamydiota bacterium]
MVFYESLVHLWKGQNILIFHNSFRQSFTSFPSQISTDVCPEKFAKSYLNLIWKIKR